MCDHFLTVAKGGGQNRKARKNRGRRADVITSTLEHIQTTAPPSMFPAHHHPEYETTAVSSDLSCPVCAAVLERPLQLACGNIVCHSCCYRWISTAMSGPISCPCCYNHQLDSTTIHPPPPMVTNLLSGLLVTCSKNCGRLVRAGQYTKHLDSKCTEHFHIQVNSPSRMTLRDVLSKPAAVPPTPAEKKVANHLVKRLLNDNPEQVIRVASSRGQVSRVLLDIREN